MKLEGSLGRPSFEYLTTETRSIRLGLQNKSSYLPTVCCQNSVCFLLLITPNTALKASPFKHVSSSKPCKSKPNSEDFYSFPVHDSRESVTNIRVKPLKSFKPCNLADLFRVSVCVCD